MKHKCIICSASQHKCQFQNRTTGFGFKKGWHVCHSKYNLRRDQNQENKYRAVPPVITHSRTVAWMLNDELRSEKQKSKRRCVTPTLISTSTSTKKGNSIKTFQLLLKFTGPIRLCVGILPVISDFFFLFLLFLTYV